MEKTHFCFNAALWFGLFVLGCEEKADSNHSTQTAGGAAGSFAATNTKGSSAPAGGGAKTTTASGGTTVTSGATSHGGTPSAGGASALVGATSYGGNAGKGGISAIAGTKSSGGTTNNSGATTRGGTSVAAGATSKGGTSAASGATGLGGMGLGGHAHVAGSPAIGGVTNGGVPSTTGGKSTTGGVTNGGASNPICTQGTPKSGGTEYCAISKGDAGGGYSYDIWTTTTGPACMTVYGSDATFKATWNDVPDVLAHVGLRFDKTKTYEKLGTISSDFAFTKTGSGGSAYIGIYGVSVDPSHEYYIVEDWIGSRPVPGNNVGTISVDGGAYEVYKNTPTSAGTPIVQFFSVRQSARQCGHISISQHFSEWARLGLTLGKLESADLVVEAMGNGSGTVEFTTGTVRAD